MRTTKELATAMRRAIADMEETRAQLGKARDEKDEQRAKTLTELYNSKVREFDTLREEHEELKKMEERVKLQREVEAKAAKSVETLTPPDDNDNDRWKVAAEAKDHSARMRRHREVFLEWVRGKSFGEFSTQEQEMLTPKSPKLREGKASGSVLMPDSLAARIMGPRWAACMGKAAVAFEPDAIAGKVMLSSDASVGTSFSSYLVPPDFRAQLQMLPFDVPSIFDRVTVVPSGTGTVTWPALAQSDANEFGGVSFQWLGEGAEKPETEPTFDQREIHTHELAGYTELSERLLSRSAIALESLLSTLFRAAMIHTLDNAIWNGTGIGMPQGIIPAAIRSVARTTPGAVVYADIVHLKHLVKSAHRSGALFFLHDEVEQHLELAVDTLGRPLFTNSMANGAYDRLSGVPYMVCVNLHGLGTRGDIVFGNPRHYVMAMEDEVTLARSEHAQFRLNRIAYKIYTVVGGRPMQPRAFSILDETES